MQNLSDRAVLASRYILVVFYLGLALAPAAYAVRFMIKVWKFTQDTLTRTSASQMLLGLPCLVDTALVASLVVMVAISSYASVVSRLTDARCASKIDWVSNLEPRPPEAEGAHRDRGDQFHSPAAKVHGYLLAL